MYALLWGSFALITHPEQPIYRDLLRVLDGGTKRAVRRLPRSGRYLVVSDHHLLYTGAPHDYFGGNGREAPFHNERVIAEMATHYGALDYTWIENGDVEDLVVTEPHHDRFNCLLVGAVGRLVLSYNTDFRSAMRERRLMRIVRTYKGYYAHLLSCFGRNRVVKLIGNHDAELLDRRVARHVPLLDGPASEFAVIEGAPPVVICHGHQMDPWTCSATARGVGESITESLAWAGQGADRIWLRKDWGPDPGGSQGTALSHDNRPVRAPSCGPARGLVPKVRHMGERRLLKQLTKVFPSAHRPWLVLGHTHEPRFLANERYVNAGAAGRYQDLVWAVEIEDAVPRLVAWWTEGEAAPTLFCGVLIAEGTRLVCKERRDMGPLPPLPYAERQTLEAIDAEVDALLPPLRTPITWVLWRAGVHVVLYASPFLVWALLRVFI